MTPFQKTEKALRSRMWMKFTVTVLTILMGLFALLGAMEVVPVGERSQLLCIVYACAFSAVSLFGVWKTFQAAGDLRKHREGN